MRTIIRTIGLAALAACAAPAGASAAVSTLEAETMSVSNASTVVVFNDAAASAGKGKAFWTNGTASATVPGAVGSLTLRARQDQAGPDHAKLEVKVDGVVKATVSVDSSTWKDFVVPVATTGTPGPHTLDVKYVNDYNSGGADRNVRLDKITIASFDTLYVLPDSAAALVRNASSGTERTQLDVIANQPTAFWSGAYGSNELTKLGNALTAADARGEVVPIVMYAIPDRDCAQYAGGDPPKTPAEYRQIVDERAALIGSRRAIIFIEPDATGHNECGTTPLATRWDLIKYATQKFAALPNTEAYIDAANSTWYWTAAARTKMIDRLELAGVAFADGIVTNTSNYGWDANESTYGKALLDGLVAKGITGKRQVIDTSRNGNGPEAGADPFNQYGRKLGTRPTLNPTGYAAHVRAALWVKPPGMTDGPETGGPQPFGPPPAAGQFWKAYALDLISRG